jgi:bifunctional enzyme CysN/CysC
MTTKSEIATRRLRPGTNRHPSTHATVLRGVREVQTARTEADRGNAARATVGSGMIHFALRRSHDITWRHIDVDKAARSRLKGQTPIVLWLTGLSGSGKSTIANLLEVELHRLGRHTYVLDGDNVRHGLNKDLGFTDADRVENVRRVAEVARLMLDAGLIVIVSLISPFRNERRMARQLVGEGEFVEVFVDAPIAVAEARDPKGLYAKARRGEILNFTGVDSPYEPPERPEIHLHTSVEPPAGSVRRVLDALLAGRR